MNLEDLYIPATMAGIMNDVLSAKSKDFGAGKAGEIIIREELLVRLFLAAGAVEGYGIQKMNKNESISSEMKAEGVKSIDNQFSIYSIPQVIVEELRNGRENLVRIIMNYQGQTLKSVAERYGGKSGAANVANFMAKSNEELAVMRDSTMRRLADALDCPIEWLLLVRDEKGGVEEKGQFEE